MKIALKPTKPETVEFEPRFAFIDADRGNVLVLCDDHTIADWIYDALNQKGFGAYRREVAS